MQLAQKASRGARGLLVGGPRNYQVIVRAMARLISRISNATPSSSDVF
jgi:hypothetical protein